MFYAGRRIFQAPIIGLLGPSRFQRGGIVPMHRDDAAPLKPLRSTSKQVRGKLLGSPKKR
ncbi:MAG: hypothetical protein R2825_01570 [Saprospiraceae bacterium]